MKWKRKRKRYVERHPGATKVVASDVANTPPVIDVFAYSADALVEKHLASVDEIPAYLDRYAVVWINVDGLTDTNVINQIGAIFKLHPLAIEDVVHLHQRAKVEDYGQTTFITARMVQFNDHLETEQISFFLGSNFVLTFQERAGKDCIDAVRERLRRGAVKLRSSGPDYLLYSLLDAVIDGYFPVLEIYGERLEQLEDEAATSPHRSVINRIHAAKTDLLALRRALWPHREMLNVLVRDEHPLIKPDTRIFLRDCYDHTVQCIDLVETYRELGADIRDLFLSSVSNRMNEVMKVLTIISTIFLPLSFIAGVYGMNFDTHVSPWNMPELEWYYGYPLSLGMMAAVAAGMIFYFRRKKWIGGGGESSVEDPNGGRSAPPNHHQA